MSSLLITGGAGFIGANFVHYWRRSHPDDSMVVLDALTYAGNPENLAGLEGQEGFRLVKGDIRGFDLVVSLMRDHDIDTIVHFAAESHVDRSIHGPDEFIDTNVVGTHQLLKAAKEMWLSGSGRPHRFHHVSTDEVYGSLAPDDPAFTEDTPYAPNSPYAASKAASDHLVRAYHHTYGLETTISNCSNNYGPYQFPEKLIPLMLINILNNKPLPVYGKGLNIRDWIHVEDHCRGLELVLEKGAVGEVYNLGGNSEKRNIEVVKTICSSMDDLFARDKDLAKRCPDAPPAQGEPSETLIAFVSDRAGHDFRYAINSLKSSRQLGFLPEINFEEGLAATIAWYLDNESWWRRVMDGSYRDWLSIQYGSLD